MNAEEVGSQTSTIAVWPARTGIAQVLVQPLAFGRVDPVHVLTYDGVPIISVYENPRRRSP